MSLASRYLEKLTIMTIALATLLILVSSVFAADKAGLCKVELHSLRRTSGASGDVFEMHGKWEENQGGKTASINMGSPHKLEVLSWSSSVIRVKIPAGLRPGSYKVGVYCNNPPHWQGSGFKDFEVTGGGSEAGSYEGRPLIEGPESINERRGESIPQANAPQAVVRTEEGNAIAADTEKNLNTGIWVLVVIVIAIIVIARKR